MSLKKAADWTLDWISNAALPVWWEYGADRKRGGFYEQLNQDGSPVEMPRRFRTQARQLYVYAESQHRGYFDSTQAIEHGLHTVLPLYALGQGFPKLLSAEGKVTDSSFDLYDNVFGLLGLGAAYRVTAYPHLERMAKDLVATIEKRHPYALGLLKEPVPLRADPLMHFFEVCMYWGEITKDDFWLSRAAATAKRAMETLFSPETNTLHELVDAGWQLLGKGDFVSPGHHFEWAWLLDRWRKLGGEDYSDICTRLYAWAETHGIDTARKVAVDECDHDGSVKKATARQWPQIERLRAALSQHDESVAMEAFTATQRYLDAPMRGLWHDTMQADGTMAAGPAWTSSFYHYLGMAIELQSATTKA